MWLVDFEEWLQQQIQKNGYTYDELAELSGISKGYISFVLTGKRKVTRNFCVAIARGLGFDPIYVLSKAGLISEAEIFDDSTQELLKTVKKLNDEKKKTVLRFAKFVSKEPD